MKKLKLFLMMTMVALTLCACGGEAAQSSPEDSKANAEVSQEDKKEDKKDTNSAKESSFACLPEMKDATIEDCMVQVGNSIIKLDMTMSLQDVVTAFSDSGLNVVIKDEEEKELNFGGLIQAGESAEYYVYVDGVKYYFISFINLSDGTVKIDDEAVVLQCLTAWSMEACDCTYFCYGIPANGEGYTYESIKEEYPDFEETDEVFTGHILLRKVAIMECENGQRVQASLAFTINLADGSCVGAGYDVLRCPY